MKRVSARAQALLLLVLAVLVGLSLYVIKLAVNGSGWISYPADQAVYANGVLKVGTVLDRNGLVLSTVTDGKRTFADDKTVRQSTLHAVGDMNGNIGTSALSRFAPDLIGYNFFTGTYSRTGTGKNLSLTVDANLNVAAYKALSGKKGAVGVMNYKTGELLCMVSAPSFDPENVPDLTGSQYTGAYINRFLSSAYTPGSTFKLVTLAAAIDNIPDVMGRAFDCAGSLKVGGETVNDNGKHGKLSIEDALAVSCNVTFARLALELGADKLDSYASRFGLTSSLDVDGIKTAAGSFSKGAAGSADLAWSGIGQYNDTVCPANMLHFVAAIPNGGIAPDLHVIRKNGLAGLIPNGSKRLLSKETAEKIGTMMNYDVYKTYGKDNFPGLDLSAKSGTAEVGGGQAAHSWFVGFITNKDEPLAFVVIVENGGSGAQTAGAVANAVLQVAVKNGVH